MKTYLQDILSYVSYSRQGKQHVNILGITKKLKHTFCSPHSVLTNPIPRAVTLQEPTDLSQPLPGRIRTDPEVEIDNYFPETIATRINPDLFTACSASHVINCSLRLF